MGKPRDDKNAVQDLARDLADIAGQLASLNGEAKVWLSDPNYIQRPQGGAGEGAYAAVEAAIVEVSRRPNVSERKPSGRDQPSSTAHVRRDDGYQAPTPKQRSSVGSSD